MALPVPRGQHHPVAAGGDGAGAARARLRRPGLRAEQDRGHRRLQGRGPQRLRADPRALRRPHQVQLQARGHDLVVLQADRADERPGHDLPRGDPHPGRLPRHQHRPPADGQVPHLHDHHRGDEERLWRAAQHQAPLHPLVDPRDAGRSPGHPKGDPQRAVRDHGRHHRRRRSRAADYASGDQERHAGVRGSGGDRRRGGLDDGLRSDGAGVHPPGRRAGSGPRPSRRHRSGRRHRAGRSALGLLGG